MRKEEFAARLRALLPGASEAALDESIALAEDPETEEDMGREHFYDSLYVELWLVRRDYGEELAQTLFNCGDFHPHELRGAARLMAEGWQAGQIAAFIEDHGWECDLCERTPAEEAESQAALWLFQHGAQGLDGLNSITPPKFGFGQEMG